ncbi:MAG: response regulator [Patescibacteria group bacterium]
MPNPKILVVDDDALLRDLMVDILDDCTVVIANDGLDGLQRYRDEGPFDVVVSDLEMPGGNGPDMIRAIRKHCPTQPILLISGNPLLLEKAQTELGVRVMGKPFETIYQFNEAVRQLVSNGRLVRT